MSLTFKRVMTEKWMAKKITAFRCFLASIFDDKKPHVPGIYFSVIAFV